MLSTDNLVTLLRVIADVASKSQDHKIILKGEDIVALEDAAKYIEDRVHDDTRQAAPLEDNAQFWRDHCRDLLNHDAIRMSMEAGDPKTDAAIKVLSSSEIRGSCQMLKSIAERHLIELLGGPIPKPQ